MKPRSSVNREQGDAGSTGLVDGPGWQLFAYGLWVLGCVLFALVAVDNRDWRSFAASLFFLVGVVAVMIPLERQRRAAEESEVSSFGDRGPHTPRSTDPGSS